MQRTHKQNAGPAGLVGCAAALLLVAGCHGKTHIHSAPAPSAILEQEPNDSSTNPQPIAFLAASDYVAIKGHIDDSGFDPYDGFAFTVDRKVQVEVKLSMHSPGTDLDLVVYDPLLDADVVFFQSPYNPEGGTFWVDASPAFPVDFDLVVSSFFGSSTYTLEVRTYPLPATYAASSALPGTGGGAASASRLGAGAGGSSAAPDGRAGLFDAWSASDDAGEEPIAGELPVVPTPGVLLFIGPDGEVLRREPALLLD